MSPKSGSHLAQAIWGELVVMVELQQDIVRRQLAGDLLSAPTPARWVGALTTFTRSSLSGGRQAAAARLSTTTHSHAECD